MLIFVGYKHSENTHWAIPLRYHYQLIKITIMTQEELLKTAVGNGLLDSNWLYCFNQQCNRHGECARFLSSQYKPDRLDHGPAVYPDACRDGNCQYFNQLRIVRTAWGFGNLFHNVKLSDVPTLRTRMKKLLGSQTSYYRYHQGKRHLTPEQQTAINKLFAQYGYNDIAFEHYQEEITLT